MASPIRPDRGRQVNAIHNIDGKTELDHFILLKQGIQIADRLNMRRTKCQRHAVPGNRSKQWRAIRRQRKTRLQQRRDSRFQHHVEMRHCPISTIDHRNTTLKTRPQRTRET